MKHLICIAALAGACALPTAAYAAPGLGEEVYGTSAEKGEWEFEARYDRLSGGADSGEDVLKFEATYAVTERLRIAVLTELAKEPGDKRRAEELGVEAIYRLGKVGPIDFAIYGEYTKGLNGNSDALEGKLIMEHRSGRFDARLNLTATKPLVSGEAVELSYAVSADVAATPAVRLGVQAFGDLGTSEKFLPRAEHFIGPVAKFRVPTGDRDGDNDGDEGIGIELGYLFAAGQARENTNGQLRFAVEFEF